jgi:hypothetical protein
MSHTDELLHEWVEASLVREDGDTDTTKAQAIAAGRYVLAFANDALGHESPDLRTWASIPSKVRRAAIDTMVDEASDLGLALKRGEIQKQASTAIDCGFRFPEIVSTKVMIEAYSGSEYTRRNKQRVLTDLMQVAAGHEVPSVPINVVERISHRRQKGKRYTVTLHDFYEAQGRRSYLAGSRQTSQRQVMDNVEQMTGVRPMTPSALTSTPRDAEPRAVVIRQTNDWWEEVVKGRMAIRRALHMLTERDDVQPNPLAVEALTTLQEDIAGMIAILQFRNVDEVRV